MADPVWMVKVRDPREEGWRWLAGALAYPQWWRRPCASKPVARRVAARWRKRGWAAVVVRVTTRTTQHRGADSGGEA